jgi:hypothetical protein
MTMAKQDRSITPDTSKALIEDAEKLMAEAGEMAARSAQHVVEADARLATSRKIVEQSRQLLRQSGYGSGVSTETADERDRLSKRVRQAQSHVSLGEKHISTLQRIVAEFERDGHDSALARQVLATFERTQAMHVADRDELMSKLEKNPTPSPATTAVD